MANAAQPRSPFRKGASVAQDPDEAPTAAPPASTTSRRILFAGFAALALAVVSFSIVTTTAVDSALGTLLTTIGIALAVFLILVGLLSPADSSTGLVANALKLLPAVSAWACASGARLATAILLLSGISILAYWIGPVGIQQVSIACDQAAKLNLRPGDSAQPCADAFSGKLWRWPQRRTATLEVTCLNAKDQGWPATLDTNGKGKCGARPRASKYVTNGIDAPPLDTDTVVGRRTRDRLHQLRADLSKAIKVDRTVKDRLLFATWSFRDLGGHLFVKTHLSEADVYIAEIISHFDLVALQEILSRDAIDRIMKLLGPDYKLALSFQSPDIGGRKERLAFVYDTRKVRLNGIASNVVIMSNDGNMGTAPGDAPESTPRNKKSKTGQPCRPPFFAEFDVLGHKITILTFHIYFGRSLRQTPQYARRLSEIRDIFSYISKVLKQDKAETPLLVAGDLQAADADGPELKILEDLGYQIDPDLKKTGTNTSTKRPYDQIALLPGTGTKIGFGIGGAYNYYQTVFRDNDADEYKIEVINSRRSRREFDWRKWYLSWRTSQMSDHLPKWVALRLQ